MALAPIAQVSTPFEDYAGYWLKAYQQGTTTPIVMATDSGGLTTVAKAEISSGGTVPIGFIKTAGDVIFIPYINEAYDLWLFPTEAEADANDTDNAIQVADNIAFLQDFANQVGALKVFDTVALMVADADLAIGNIVNTAGYISTGDGGDNSYEIVAGGTGTDDGGSFIDLNNGNQAKALFPDGFKFEQWGVDVTGVIESSTKAQAAIDYVAGLASDGSLSWLGTISINTPLQLKFGISLFGHGGTSSKILADDCDGLVANFATGFGNTVLRDFYIQGENASTTTRYGILNNTSLDIADELYGFTVRDVLVTDFHVGFSGRHFRNLTVDNCWFQDVQRGMELIGRDLVCYITKNKFTMASPPPDDGGANVGLVMDDFNFTTAGGIEAPEGVQINNNQFFGFDIGINADFVNFVNIVENDTDGSEIGIKFATVVLGCNIKDNICIMKTAAAEAGIKGSGLASPSAGAVSIEGNTIMSAGTTTNLVGIKINDSGNQNQNNIGIVRNLLLDCDLNDIKVNNAGPTTIEDNWCFSTNPANSIDVPNVVLGPVYIDKNQCAGLINTTAAERANAQVIIGNNVIGGTSQIWGNETIPAVASVAALTLGLGSRIFTITGTTNITSIVTSGWTGKSVTLKFDGILTVTDGSNLKLNGNFVTASTSTLTLFCDGTDWFETGRSSN
jgi:hypothetical protein